jgi:nitrogen fixation NifU-like protein
MDLQNMYQEIILDHQRHPHHKGLQEPYDVEVHHVNPTCGDEVTLRVLLTDGASPVVEEVSYDGLGCAISQASTSVMTDVVSGRPLEEALVAHQEFLTLMYSKGKQVDVDEELLDDAIAFSGVSQYPARIKCALLGWMAFKDAAAQAVAAKESA